MKHSKWLLILILSLIIINLVFYVTWYAFNIQGKIKTGIEEYISRTLNCTLKLNQLSINENQVTINSIYFQTDDKKIQLIAKQIQIKYNLLRIILSGFKINKAIKQIDIHQPDVYVDYFYTPPKEKKKTEIPDLTSYFNNLNIEDGKLMFSFSVFAGSDSSDIIRVTEKFNDININVKNTNETNIRLRARNQNNGTINLTAKIADGMITLFDTKLENYRLSKVEYNKIHYAIQTLQLILPISKMIKGLNLKYLLILI